jgi:predicted secreted acid phosphatase
MAPLRAKPIRDQGALPLLIALASSWLFFAPAAPALAQTSCANPPDYAAKCCPPQALSLDVPQPQDLQSTEEPMNVGEYKRKLTNYKCSGDYDKAVAEVLDKAIDYVEQHASDATRPALVLDIDETSLSNWPAILTDDYALLPDGPCDLTIAGTCGWRAWQYHAKDEAIAPTLKLFNTAKAKGVAVFFITGRCEIGPAREATEANLEAAGYDGWADLIMRPKDCPKLDTVVEFKASARVTIEAQGYKIIANVGDQWSDLNGGHSEQNFKVPNPFYFIK